MTRPTRAAFFCNFEQRSGFSGHLTFITAMKTLPALAFIVALAAFILFPLRFEIAGSILFAAGFAAIIVSDYTRTLRPLRIPAAPVGVAAERKERFGLAA
jgi:hypothetical protein